MSKKQQGTFTTHISGIPCQIKVTTFNHIKPWGGPAYEAPSDLDYYGYVEFEYQVLDRKGYDADWLVKKMTDEDDDRILKEYQDYLERNYS